MSGRKPKTRAGRAALTAAKAVQILFVLLQAICAFAGAVLLAVMLYRDEEAGGTALGVFRAAASLIAAAAAALLALPCLLINRFATRVLHYSADIAAAVLLAASAGLALAAFAGWKIPGYIFILLQPALPVIEAYGFEKNRLINRNKEKKEETAE
ncbi:MAG: hypothetical protein J6V01_02715 [Clostridia bacterium]|nr:hypothetical protein [Clostridia bacterium]